MRDEKRPDEPKAEPDLKRPDEAIKDLEPDEHESAAVMGGVMELKTN